MQTLTRGKKHWAKLQNWGVIEQWANVYKAEVDKFEANFETAVSRVAGRLKDKE